MNRKTELTSPQIRPAPDMDTRYSTDYPDDIDRLMSSNEMGLIDSLAA